MTPGNASSAPGAAFNTAGVARSFLKRRELLPRR
jgi:hypothetical protein